MNNDSSYSRVELLSVASIAAILVSTLIRFGVARQVENDRGDISHGRQLHSFHITDALRWDAAAGGLIVIGIALAILAAGSMIAGAIKQREN